MKTPLNLNNRWHRLWLWATACVLGFALLLILTVPDKTTPPQAPAEPQQTTVIPQAAAPNPEKAQLILELFNPGDASLHQQLTTTAIEQQLEQALTTSFVLRKCDLLSHDEYRDTFRALILYAQQTKLAPDAPTAERELRRISESSGTSYALIYSRTKCDDARLRPLAYQLTSWTQLTLTQSPEHP